MSLQAFHSGLKTQLLADTGLSSWANTHFGTGLTAVDGNVPVKTLAKSKLPALVFELGDGDNSEDVGNRIQSPETEMLLAVIWNEQDSGGAFTQRVTLPDLMIQALMVDGTLGGAVSGAWVSGWEPDRAANHPLHVMRFTVTAQYLVKKP